MARWMITPSGTIIIEAETEDDAYLQGRQLMSEGAFQMDVTEMDELPGKEKEHESNS